MCRSILLTLTLPLVISTASVTHAQRVVSNDFSKYSSVTTYGIEYLIKGVDTAGLDILCKIPIERYTPLRKKNERVEVRDAETGVIIILFSEKELQIIRHPLYTFKQINGRKNE